LTANLVWNPGRVPRLPRRASPGKAQAALTRLMWNLTASVHLRDQRAGISRKVGWSSPPSIIATRRLKSSFIAELQLLHLAQPVLLTGRMQFKVEIEARLTNSELWIPSTLVFILKTRFRVVAFFSIFRDLRGRFDHRPNLAVGSEVATVFETIRILFFDILFFGGA